ncbi:MAG: DUF86 domain-containing protein [Rhodospirillaceae bacterium]|nr:DUF86 domain-containing protein [Rhodospirillaceae bacterium]
MRRDQAAYVLDMLIAAREAVGFAEDLTFEAFVADRRTQLSVVKSIEIVGEAASRVDDEIRQAHPAIPWQDIVGMRNRLVHGYFDIDLRLVWDTVGTDLPELIGHLEGLLPKDEG